MSSYTDDDEGPLCAVQLLQSYRASQETTFRPFESSARIPRFRKVI